MNNTNRNIIHRKQRKKRCNWERGATLNGFVITGDSSLMRGRKEEGVEGIITIICQVSCLGRLPISKQNAISRRLQKTEYVTASYVTHPPERQPLTIQHVKLAAWCICSFMTDKYLWHYKWVFVLCTVSLRQIYQTWINLVWRLYLLNKLCNNEWIYSWDFNIVYAWR